MERRHWTGLLVFAFAAGWAIRMYNVAHFPPLRAFDGFGHFTYIWHLLEYWRVPSPTAGWSFFHPPLYYAFMAGIWNLFDGLDPFVRLRIGIAVVATLGLAPAALAWDATRRALPEKPAIAALAAGLMLFLPVHLFTAGFLGNEGLNAVLCTLSLAALLSAVREPGWRRGAVLGACLGLAMLTKFTAVAFVAGAAAALILRTVILRDWKRGLLALAAMMTVMLSLCGWFYARNILEYGEPFKASREEFFVRRYEDFQTSGRRDLLEYVLFDPLIVYRPQWPRGIPLTGELAAGTEHSRLRESVWTGVFANTFFDSAGWTVLPGVNFSEPARRAGQLLLTLGLVPTILVLVGIVAAIRRLRRQGWDDTLVPMLTTFAAMIAVFVLATRAVPLNAAVKATYLTPASAIFAFWFALGTDSVAGARPRLFRWLAAWCAALFALSAFVFTLGLFIARGWLEEASSTVDWVVPDGIVYHMAGWHEHARQSFRRALDEDWHTANENLAMMALEEDRPLEALRLMQRALVAAPAHSFGTPEDKATYNRITRAEYLNKIAIIHHRLGQTGEAIRAAREAYESDPSIPEVSYDLALLTLEAAVPVDGQLDDARAAAAVAAARDLIERTLASDPEFDDARALAGVASVIAGECREGLARIREAPQTQDDSRRRYPVRTGVGDGREPAIRRRMHIRPLPARLRFDEAPPWCHDVRPPG